MRAGESCDSVVTQKGPKETFPDQRAISEKAHNCLSGKENALPFKGQGVSRLVEAATTTLQSEILGGF